MQDLLYLSLSFFAAAGLAAVPLLAALGPRRLDSAPASPPRYEDLDPAREVSRW